MTPEEARNLLENFLERDTTDDLAETYAWWLGQRCLITGDASDISERAQKILAAMQEEHLHERALAGDTVAEAARVSALDALLEECRKKAARDGVDPSWQS